MRELYSLVGYLLLGVLMAASAGCKGDNRPPETLVPKVAAGSPTRSVEAARWYNQGVSYLRSEDESAKVKAIEAFTKAIEIDPGFESAIYNRALMYVGVGRDSDAVADLRTLQSRKSKEADTLQKLFAVVPDAYVQLGDRAHESGNYALALEKYSAAMVYAPQWPVLYKQRARTYRALGKVEEAVRDESEAAKLESQTPSP